MITTLKHTEKEIKRIKSLLNFKGKRIREADFEPGMSLASYWDSGYRDYYYFLNLKTGQVTEVPQNGTPFDQQHYRAGSALESDTVLVRKTFSGEKQYLTIYS
jgi:hypothetical protein